MEKIIVTGAAGFIGAALINKLLENNYKVVGIDNLNDYYDIKLKQDRLKNIEKLNYKNIDNWFFENVIWLIILKLRKYSSTINLILL